MKQQNKKAVRPTVTGGSVKFWKATALTLLVLVLSTQFFDVSVKPKFNFFGLLSKTDKISDEKVDIDKLKSEVISEKGVELPINWGNIGSQMVSDGVIDEVKFRELFSGGLSEAEEKILTGEGNKSLVMTQENSRFILDVLWAFGLANKNEILTSGEMTDDQYGGDASKFASTGGWSLSRGDVMNHYSAHPYVVLTKDQQNLVDKVSLGIFRPCCGNSTHFPDCNHGMAMLGLLELMAANGVSEKQMYITALQVNTLWFPQAYIDLATFFKEQGQDWDRVNPKEVLSQDYSSGQGYASTRKKIKSLPSVAEGGGGCGV